MSSPDIEVIERLRKENMDQFFTLVRMHLSFVVDICTDDVDGTAEKPKPFRWNFSKKNKNNINNGNGIKPCESPPKCEEDMSKLYELIDFLSKDDNVTQEGIFRRTGSLSRQQELRQLISSGSTLNLEEGRFSVHDCASVLKGFLADLSQPLLMDQNYQTYCTLAGQYPPNLDTSESKLLTALQLLLLLLSPQHRDFLQRLFKLLTIVADNEESNRMSPDTLATMFTPHLLCPRKLSPETFHAEAIALAPVISFMIRHSDALFDAPAQLVTDVSAYFTIRERKKMLSPDIDLDESITDRTAANTVYTFVDRHRTSIENEINQTDTALAQLYAHIQALPDSQHKRRLIKQFNRQNGYGTPIQVQRTGKAAGSRSFGDSIKRHIFAKGILNKTPKKGSVSSLHSVEEKLTNKERLRNDDKEVSHRNVVLKNLVTKMSNADCLDYDSDTTNDSTLSENALDKSRKLSPKFVSEPNLSIVEAETPKKRPRLFRSKQGSNVNKRYQKRNTIKGTPTCVSCVEIDDESRADTPKLARHETPHRMNIDYLTSTPGVTDMAECSPYVNLRRSSMSPISKSTQKLSKAMQESIMTPRSRKPLIITSEQRDSLPENETKPEQSNSNMYQSDSNLYQSISIKNDSDFVSSDDESQVGKSSSSTSDSSKTTNKSVVSLTEPFREYLLSRSVLTATPIDLSILNKSTDCDKITESLLYCLDGNNPADLTSSINNLVVESRSPLKSINRYIDNSISPNRKRPCAKETDDSDSKKAFIDKENFELRETEL